MENEWFQHVFNFFMHDHLRCCKAAFLPDILVFISLGSDIPVMRKLRLNHRQWTKIQTSGLWSMAGSSSRTCYARWRDSRFSIFRQSAATLQWLFGIVTNNQSAAFNLCHTPSVVKIRGCYFSSRRNSSSLAFFNQFFCIFLHNYKTNRQMISHKNSYDNGLIFGNRGFLVGHLKSAKIREQPCKFGNFQL